MTTPEQIRRTPAMTIAISVGAHNLSVFPVILAVIIIGVVLYFTLWRRRKPPDDRGR
jgi:hypothetical protein